MALGTATKQGAGGGGGGGSSTITSFLGSTTNGPVNITQIGGNAVTTTIPVSGTVTANAGTGTFNIQSNASVNIAQIGGASFALGQQLAAASLPVVLTAAQLTTLTPPSNTGYALDSSLTTIDTDLKSNITLHAGSNVIGKVGIDQTTPGTTNLVALAANQSVNVSQINGVTPLMGNGVTGTGSQRVTIASDNTVLPAVGAGATGSAVPSNASYQGFDAATALPSAATAGNTVGGMSDKFGRQVILPVTIRDLVGTQTTTISASTTETTIVTAAASTFNDLVMLIISNTSASTNTRIDFRDTTSGTILFSLESIGGAAPIGFCLPVPIPQTSVNTNWTAQCATSTTDIRIYAVFVKNK